MNAEEAQAAYRITKSQLDAGQITLEDYNKKIAELRYLDNTGTWWAINPADGSWLKWTGSAWVPAFAQAVPVMPQAPVQPAIQQPAVQQPVLQEAVKPSWFIPPVSSQQEPATQPATAPSYYIPPAGAGQQPVMQQPMVQQPVAAGQSWSKGKKYAAVSIACALVAFILSPYILGFIAIITGAGALKEKYKYGAIGLILGFLVILMDYFYLLIFK